MDLKDTISKYLKKLGVAVNLSGYKYLREAVELVITDDVYRLKINKKLYPKIAEKFGNTPTGVERAIRYACEMSADRGNYNLLCDVFGSTISADRGRATNKEFIYTLADYIKENEVCGQ